MSLLFPDDPAPPARKAAAVPKSHRARPKASPTELPPLEPGWVLAHCDGGARGNPGPSGFGAVIADDRGQPLAELSEFLGFRTNNFAEYSGLLAVLAWALEHGRTRVRLISDSELMVKQIQGKYKVSSPDLRPLYEEARRRIARLDGFQIQHALRHKNKDADRLANEAMDRGMGKGSAADSGRAELRATPYPTPGSAPAAPVIAANLPRTATKAEPDGAAIFAGMLRGFVRDGVVHPLGGGKLVEGSFVKILPE